MKVVYTPASLQQIDAVVRWIEGRNPDAARRVAARIRAVIDLLRTHPEIGHATDRPGQRRIVVTPYPYAVFYRIRGGTVFIQRVRHTSRRPD